MSLENAGDARSGPGPWFAARLDGNCSCCSAPIDEGDEIRADGYGSYEGRACCGGDTDAGADAQRFDGTSDEEMGF